MALGDAKKTNRQLKAIKRKEGEAKRAEEREAKKMKEEEDLNERQKKEASAETNTLFTFFCEYGIDKTQNTKHNSSDQTVPI